jgi:hypothetical protein
MLPNRKMVQWFSAGVMAALAGCVTVNPSNVSVSGINVGRSNPGPPETPYASALRDVIEQQGAVRAEIDAGDWDDAADEISDWIQYTRTLQGYADTSHDPVRFRAYGQELLTAIDRVQQAAARRDARAAQTALRACDPILDKFARDFPLTAPNGQRSTPPPQPQKQQTPARVP